MPHHCCFGGHSGLMKIAGGVALLAAVAKIFGAVSAKRSEAAFRTLIANDKKDVVYLYYMGRVPGSLSPSSPCVKVEAFLRAAKIPHVIRFVPNSVSPSGTLPFISHNGNVVSESTVIIHYLAKQYKVDIDAHLDDVQKAHVQFIGWFAEDHLRWYDYRTLLVDNTEVIRPVVTSMLGKSSAVPGMVSMVMGKFRGNVIRNVDSMGMGYMPDSFFGEEYARGLKAVEAQLKASKGKFLFGNKISTADCTLFAGLHSHYEMFKTLPAPNAGSTYLAESKVLGKYVSDVLAELFPDFATITATLKMSGEEEHL